MIRVGIIQITTYILMLLMVISPLQSQSSVHSQQQPSDAYEPDNTNADATSVTIGSNQTHSIYPVWDIDTIKISINTALNVTFTVNTTQDIGISGKGDLRGNLFQISAPGGSFNIYLVPGSNSFLLFWADGITVDSYSFSISGMSESDIGNHDSNHTRPIKLDQPVYDMLNYSGHFEQDWYSFTLITRTSVRAIFAFNLFESIEYNFIKAELFDRNLTTLAKNYYFYFGGQTPESFLVTLDPGNYSLKLWNDGDYKQQSYLYNLTITSNIKEFDRNFHYANSGYLDPNLGSVDTYQEFHVLDGTLPANTSRDIVLSDWELGAFHTELSNLAGSVTYWILGTNITYSNSSEVGFVQAPSITIIINSSIASDYKFTIIHEIADFYDYKSSEQSPYELHRYNAGTTYTATEASINFPGEVDWWQFTSPRPGRLNITISSTTELNVTVYDANRTQVTMSPTVLGGVQIYSFGEINSTFILQVSLLHLENLFAHYNITVFYAETYYPIVLSSGTHSGGANSQSQLMHYLTELGVILTLGIVVMMIVQQWVKNRPKDILD